MLLGLIVLIGAFLRFYNLMWGNGYFFHPDENNMISSITRMTPEDGLHPNFFAYGQLPLYASYFLAQAMYWIAGMLNSGSENSVTSALQMVTHKDAAFGLRLIAATASTVTIFLIYYIVKSVMHVKEHTGKIIASRNQSLLNSANVYPLLAAALTAFVPGFIQSARFGTTESLLTFFFMAITLISLKILRSKRPLMPTLVGGITLGLALGTKITSASFFTAPFLALLLTPLSSGLSIYKKTVTRIVLMVFLVWTALLFFIASSPYTVLDFKEFMGTSRYEASVATGESNVFYTRQFIDTVPFLFQAENVLPFTLGFGLFLAGILGTIVLPYFVGATRSRVLRSQYAVLVIPFLIFFAANTMLFVKWTRFLTPALPFIIIFAVLSVAYFEAKLHPKNKIYARLTAIAILLATMLSGLAFFSLYTRNDVRISASEWIYDNVPKESYLLFDTGNVIDIPVHISSDEPIDKSTGAYNYTLVSFDFYGLDEREDFLEQLTDHLEKSDYIFVPSRRVFTNHMRFPERFPRVYNYFTGLFSGQLGFEQVAEFNSFPSLGPFTFPDEHAEETWTVFDHPVIRIYKKTTAYDKLYYRQFLASDNL